MALKIAEKKEFFDVYQNMTAQFPPAELKSFDEMAKLFESENYKLLIAEVNEQKVGYVIILLNPYQQTIWLDYFAIYKKFQSKGFGTKILNILKEIYPSKGCFVELEKPNEALPETIKRISFYEKQGAYKLDLNYLYPNENGGLPMDLYFLPFDKKFKPDKKEILENIEYCFQTIHKDLKHIDDVLKMIKK